MYRQNKSVERIRKIMNHFALEELEFASLTGIDQQELNQIINGKSNPTLDVLQRIGSAFPNIEARWLFMGEGRWFVPESSLPTDRLRITIRVEEESFQLAIERPEEEYYRLAAKSLKEKINEFCLLHPEYEIERILKLTAFHYAIEVEKSVLSANFYRNAVLNLRDRMESYSKQFRGYPRQKLLAIVAYYFALKNTNNSRL